MTQTSTVRRRLTGPARRERIEAAAVESFAERGYDATAIGEIAAAAGVARTVLYDHFPSKRALYLHVLETQNTEMLEHVGRGITGSGASPDRMRATIEAYLEFARARPSARRLLVDPIPSGDPELDQVIADYRATRADVVADLLEPDLARAGIPLGSPAVPVVVALLIAGVDGVAQWWRDHPDTPLEEVAGAAYRLLWNGLPQFVDD